MPLFTYLCEDCSEVREVLVRNAEAPVCPGCGSGRLVKQASAFAPVNAAPRADGPAPCGSGACCMGEGCPYN